MVIREAKKRHQQESTNPAGAAWRYEGLGIRRLIRFGLGRRCILVWYMSICGGKDRGREENVGLWAETPTELLCLPTVFQERLSACLHVWGPLKRTRFPFRLLPIRAAFLPAYWQREVYQIRRKLAANFLGYRSLHLSTQLIIWPKSHLS